MDSYDWGFLAFIGSMLGLAAWVAWLAHGLRGAPIALPIGFTVCSLILLGPSIIVFCKYLFRVYVAAIKKG
jgi:hypothetical protein